MATNISMYFVRLVWHWVWVYKFNIFNASKSPKKNKDIFMISFNFCQFHSDKIKFTNILFHHPLGYSSFKSLLFHQAFSWGSQVGPAGSSPHLQVVLFLLVQVWKGIVDMETFRFIKTSGQFWDQGHHLSRYLAGHHAVE